MYTITKLENGSFDAEYAIPNSSYSRCYKTLSEAIAWLISYAKQQNNTELNRDMIKFFKERTTYEILPWDGKE